MGRRVPAVRDDHRESAVRRARLLRPGTAAAGVAVVSYELQIRLIVTQMGFENDLPHGMYYPPAAGVMLFIAIWLKQGCRESVGQSDRCRNSKPRSQPRSHKKNALTAPPASPLRPLLPSLRAASSLRAPRWYSIFSSRERLL